jgi:hypothetical protein
VLKHHPDKKSGATVDSNDDAFFKCVQKAMDVVTHAAQRRQFDSVDYTHPLCITVMAWCIFRVRISTSLLFWLVIALRFKAQIGSQLSGDAFIVPADESHYVSVCDTLSLCVHTFSLYLRGLDDDHITTCLRIGSPRSKKSLLESADGVFHPCCPTSYNLLTNFRLPSPSSMCSIGGSALCTSFPSRYY